MGESSWRPRGLIRHGVDGDVGELVGRIQAGAVHLGAVGACGGCCGQRAGGMWETDRCGPGDGEGARPEPAGRPPCGLIFVPRGLQPPSTLCKRKAAFKKAPRGRFWRPGGGRQGGGLGAGACPVFRCLPYARWGSSSATANTWRSLENHSSGSGGRRGVSRAVTGRHRSFLTSSVGPSFHVLCLPCPLGGRLP